MYICFIVLTSPLPFPLLPPSLPFQIILQVNTIPLDPYMLQLELQDIARPLRSDVDGNQTLESLARFPRIIQAGEDTEMVRGWCGFVKGYRVVTVHFVCVGICG